MESIFDNSSRDESVSDMGSGNFGCSHYRRRCKIRAPCCNEIVYCRHCHNESKNSLNIDPLSRHDIPRHELKRVICSLCNTEQDVQQNCIKCGVCMGNYYCLKCKFFDDDVSKNQYHCDKCGICRTGGKENFFHCTKCGCCYSNLLKGSHICVERTMHHNCPVCFEYLFDTTKDLTVLPCGHSIHLECVKGMACHFQVPTQKWKVTVNLFHKPIVVLMELPAFGILALFAQSHFVICPMCGKSLIRRLLLPPCLKCIKIRWFGSSAMIAEKHLRCFFTSWHTSAPNATRTIQGRYEAALLHAHQELHRR
ncbi:hypothetical protein RJ639_002605 [Escallonia herrerae]|uniref:Uncharacterized protein n=1 Tax=Escallonia herrerae TaxID=1293975 RepID=A0AA89BNC1_9ASTE|nr:hypothetical protein RJ639_002605 [Escallonia herrerae]